MKKKILALVLCLVLCLPFVLTSCFGGSGDLNKTLASFKPEYEASFNSYSTAAFEGEVVSQNGKFAFTKKTINETITREVVVDRYYDDSYGYYRDIYEYRDVATKTTNVYRVYNVLTSSEIYTATTAYMDYNYDSYNGGYYGMSGWETSLQEVGIAQFGENLFILREYEYSNTYKVIDATGYCHLSSSSTDLEYDILDNLDKEAVIFDNSLYLFDTETNTLSNVKTFKENSIEGFVRNLYQVGDKYVLLDRNSDVYVFDSQFKQLYGTNFKTFAADKFESNVRTFVLNSGDILAQIQYKIGSYSDLFEDKYDFIVNGECYRLETYLYTVDNGSYKEIDCSYVIEEIATKDEAVENDFVGLPDEAENLAYVYVIEDEGIVYQNNNETVWATLSNSGDIEVLEIDDLGYYAVALNDTRYMIEGEFFTRIYNEKGELIGELGDVEEFNKNFIVTEEAIYDMNLNSVVTLDNDTHYYAKTDESIIYTDNYYYSSDSTSYFIAKYDEYGYTTTNQIVTSESSSYSSYYTTASLTVNDRFFAVIKNSYSYDYYYSNQLTSRTITFYQENGYEIARFDLPLMNSASDYIHVSTFDDCVVYSIESSTGNYFVTLKTAVNSSVNP